ncbi:AAWKG family protein [Streptomyces mirabilis]|uniref:AAWKG family protein n=1 Tax=Streptomyces mirabilis TaxID=68239 RepID=UPI0033B8195E
MPATNDADDYWGKAVTLYTGYPVPSRKTAFDKLKSKEGIPLFRMDIQSMDVRAVTAEDYSAISGWMKHDGEDYDLVFYTAGGDGAQSGAQMHRARIVLIGVPDDANGRARLLDPGEMTSGGAFTGHYGDQWDAGPMSQYISGAKAALDKLLTDHTTRGFSYAGATVLDAEAVDLNSFERTAQAFDRATKFFIDQAAHLEQWETSLGSEQSSWKGQAAGVFWHLVHQLHKNYDSYVEQLGGVDYHAAHTTLNGLSPKSKFGDTLAMAQQQLVAELTNLQNAWTTWANSAEHDPHRSVLEMLDDLSAWVLANNVPYIEETTTYGGEAGSSTSYSTRAEFKENHPVYGNLNDIQSWKKLGEAAVERWNNYVNQTLVPVATQSLSTLNGDWIDAGSEFEEPLKTKDTSSLTEFYQQEQNQLNQDQLNKNQQDLNNALNNNQQNLNDGLNNLGNNLNNLGNNLNDGLGNIGDGLNDGLGNIGDGLNNSLGNVTTGLNNSLGNIGDGLNNGLSGLNNLSTNLNGGLNGGLDGNSGLNNGPSGLNTGPGAPLSSSLNGLGLNSALDKGGSSTLTNPGGGTTRLNADGTLTTDFPDGSRTTFNPATGTMTTTSPSGQVTTTRLNTGDSFTNPDGSTTTLNADGTLTTKFPDGTSTTLNPTTGAATTTHPDGSVTTTHLNTGLGSGADSLSHHANSGSSTDLNSLNGLKGLDGSTSLHSGGLNSDTLNSGSLNSGSLNSGALHSGSDGLGGDDLAYDDYDSTPFSGGALGAPTGSALTAGSAAAQPTGGTPLNPGGLGGMGGAGNSSSSERVRKVLDETGGAALRRPTVSRSRASGDEEEREMILTRGSTPTSSSGSPFYPPGGGSPAAGQGNQSTESGDRERSSWVPEDEDVWGTDEGGAPAVIGR